MNKHSYAFQKHIKTADMRQAGKPGGVSAVFCRSGKKSDHAVSTVYPMSIYLLEWYLLVFARAFLHASGVDTAAIIDDPEEARR